VSAGIPPPPAGAELHTVTVVGRCPRPGRLGLGTATRSLAVGARVSRARAGLGAHLRQVDARVLPLPEWPSDRAR
jgi:hypothetical protein